MSGRDTLKSPEECRLTKELHICMPRPNVCTKYIRMGQHLWQSGRSTSWLPQNPGFEIPWMKTPDSITILSVCGQDVRAAREYRGLTQE